MSDHPVGIKKSLKHRDYAFIRKAATTCPSVPFLPWACELSDLAMVRMLVEELGFDPHQSFDSEKTLLHSAVRHPDEDEAVAIVDYLVVECGLPVVDGPFTIACINMKFEVARRLLYHGADIHAQDNYAVVAACSIRKCLPALEWLLDQDPDLSECRVSDKQSTPFLLACETGWLDGVQCLHGRGCNVRARRSDGAHALELAVGLERNAEVVRYLVETVGGFDMSNVLIEACRGSRPENIETFRYLANQDGVDWKGCLMMASYWGHASLVEELLKRRPDDSSIRDQHGKTPFLHACERQRYVVVKLLLPLVESGRELLQGLKLACSTCDDIRVVDWSKRHDVIKVLLCASSAEPAEPAKPAEPGCGETFSLIVQRDPYRDIFVLQSTHAFLRRLGVPTPRLASYCRARMHNAVRQEIHWQRRAVIAKWARVRAPIQDLARRHTDLYQACETGDVDALDALVKDCVPTLKFRRGPHQMTPFIVACARGHVGVVDYLIRHFRSRGVRCNRFHRDTTPDDRRTALHWASAGGHADIVRQLLALPVRVTSVDKHGETPLQLAAAAGRKNMFDVAGLLLHAGANGRCIVSLSCAKQLFREVGMAPVEEDGVHCPLCRRAFVSECSTHASQPVIACESGHTVCRACFVERVRGSRHGCCLECWRPSLRRAIPNLALSKKQQM